MESSSGANEDHVGIPPVPPASSGAAATERDDAEEECVLVVVTGGSKGIGRSCVASFARRGARVLFSYCSDAAGAKAVEQSFQPPGRVQCRRLDQGDFDSVLAFAAEVDQWREGRKISTVVNNAALGVATVSSYGGLPHPGSLRPTAAARPGGGGEGGRSQEQDAARRRADEDMALMRVNALGPLWVTEALLPMMVAPPPVSVAEEEQADSATSAAAATAAAAAAAKKNPADGDGGGVPVFPAFTGSKKKRTVLFVGSVGGGSQAIFPGFRAADAMSKAAVAYASKHFASRSRAAALDGSQAAAVAAAAGSTGPETACSDSDGGIDFVCLCPGATLTDMFRASTLDKMEAKGPGELERFLRALPQGRLMLPDEVGEAVYWLCSSPAATMFHGAVIDASAGLAVRPGALTEFSF